MLFLLHVAMVMKMMVIVTMETSHLIGGNVHLMVYSLCIMLFWYLFLYLYMDHSFPFIYIFKSGTLHVSGLPLGYDIFDIDVWLRCFPQFPSMFPFFSEFLLSSYIRGSNGFSRYWINDEMLLGLLLDIADWIS